MKIISNLPALRYSGDYLKNVDIEFNYVGAGPFELAQHSPDVIITNDFHESLAASKKYPSILFAGRYLKFPCIDISIPDALLDEMSILNKSAIDCQNCDITYFNDKSKENIGFIDELKMLGNLKIMGHGFCVDELNRVFPQRLTPSFYKYGKVVAVSSKEECLKALFMGKPVISSGAFPYTYNTSTEIKNLPPRANQIEYAWSLSHTLVWAELLTKLNYEDLAEKLKTILNWSKNEV